MYNYLDEYKKICERKAYIETQLAALPKGSISHKTINGNRYSYLQRKVNGKTNSDYLKAEDVFAVKNQLKLRKEFEKELPILNTRISELEKAAKLIRNGTDQSMLLLKLTAGMDDLEVSQKNKSISFANAMNAIEGVPVSDETAQDIKDWENGAKTFVSIFTSTLKRYGFAVEV